MQDNSLHRKHFYTQTLLHRRFYTQSFYPQNPFRHRHSELPAKHDRPEMGQEIKTCKPGLKHDRGDRKISMRNHKQVKQTCTHLRERRSGHKPFSEAKAFNALIPSLRTWRRKGSTPPSVKPCCNSRSFSDISGWSEPRVTTYRGQARYESRTKSCADQLHALTNKRKTSLQLKLAKSCGFAKKCDAKVLPITH